MNPRRVPQDWKQVSAGDVLAPGCNHEGLIERYDTIARCINCGTEWMPPERAVKEAADATDRR